MSTITLSLRAEAEAEVRRATIVRVLAAGRRQHPTAAFDPGGPLIGRVRGARRRKALAGGALFIWSVTCEDAAGRLLPPALVAALVTIDLEDRGGGAARLRALVNGIDRHVPARIDDAIACRQRAIADSGRRHALARLERDRAIAADVERSQNGAGYQAGLFDRRSERLHDERADAAVHASRLAASRVDAAEAATRLRPVEPTLLLVLTARR